MKIKYLRQAPQGMPGDVSEVPDLQANVLIKLKLAEPFDGFEPVELVEPVEPVEPVAEKPKATRTRKTK